MDAFAEDHEQLILRHDPNTGLKAVFAIHSTHLGPAAGGCRRWQYADTASAVTDALRLSKSMTYKNALAGLPFGGGKSVILGDAQPITNAQLEVFGAWVEALGGRYVTAEDVGMRVADMRVVRRRTQYVSGLGLNGIGGDPSPKTALGVYRGIEIAVQRRLGHGALGGLTVAIQGLGNVGFHLAKLLHRAGAKLLVADINSKHRDCAVERFDATPVDADDILFQDVDVLAPCALGAIVDETSVERIQAPIIAGSANNQLSNASVGVRLRERGVLYAPDYVINAGGVISVAFEYLGGEDPSWINQRIDAIGERLSEIFDIAEREGSATQAVADRMVETILKASGGQPDLRVVA